MKPKVLAIIEIPAMYSYIQQEWTRSAKRVVITESANPELVQQFLHTHVESGQ